MTGTRQFMTGFGLLLGRLREIAVEPVPGVVHQKLGGAADFLGMVPQRKDIFIGRNVFPGRLECVGDVSRRSPDGIGGFENLEKMLGLIGFTKVLFELVHAVGVARQELLERRQTSAGRGRFPLTTGRSPEEKSIPFRYSGLWYFVQNHEQMLFVQHGSLTAIAVAETFVEAAGNFPR